MPRPREKPPLERAARALCKLRGLPEDARFNGAPMWHSTAPVAFSRAWLDRQNLVPWIGHVVQLKGKIG